MSPYTENNQSVTPGLANSEAGGSYEHGGADRWNQNSRAYLLALTAYLGIFIFGYDAGVAGGVVSLPVFEDDFKFGPRYGDSITQTASYTSNVVSLLMAGAFFGALGAAPICSWLGRKWALMVGTIIFSIGAAAQTAAMTKLDAMYAGRVISGFGVGLMSTVCPTYVSEMTPRNVRGRITGMFQVIVVIGVAASYWIEYGISVGMSHQTNQWRVPIVAFTMFFLQQWGGQNSISYYAPQIFKSIGLTGTSVGLLASGIYGIVKIFATGAFIAFGIERTGRSKALGYGALGMSLFLWIVGAIFNTNPPDPSASSPSGASIGMAVCIYLFVIPYCFGWGPVPWVYSSEIFPMRTRAYGMAVAAGSQWAFNFTMSKITPYLIADLPKGGVFFLFAAINLIAAAFGFWLPETQGLSIEQMDILFGTITQEQRDLNIVAAQKARENKGDELYGLSEKMDPEVEHREMS